MRILPISDLHLERRKLNELPPLSSPFDVLVCAGDIWQSEPERSVQSIVELASGKPAILVPGNHDYYRADFQDERTMTDFERLLIEEARRQNARSRGIDLVTVLTSDNPDCEISGVKFVGLTLWTDWALAGRWASESTAAGHCDEMYAAASRQQAGHWRNGVREYGVIRLGVDRAWSPYDVVAEYARQKAILLDELSTFDPDDKTPTVVVTHHCPLPHGADVYREQGPWWTPAFYCSDLLLKMPEVLRPHAWIFGHVHAPFDEQHGRTRAVCNPVEGGCFKPNLIIEIPEDGDQ